METTQAAFGNISDHEANGLFVVTNVALDERLVRDVPRDHCFPDAVLTDEHDVGGFLRNSNVMSASTAPRSQRLGHCQSKSLNALKRPR